MRILFSSIKIKFIFIVKFLIVTKSSSFNNITEAITVINYGMKNRNLTDPPSFIQDDINRNSQQTTQQSLSPNMIKSEFNPQTSQQTNTPLTLKSKQTHISIPHNSQSTVPHPLMFQPTSHQNAQTIQYINPSEITREKPSFHSIHSHFRTKQPFSQHVSQKNTTQRSNSQGISQQKIQTNVHTPNCDNSSIFETQKPYPTNFNAPITPKEISLRSTPRNSNKQQMFTMQTQFRNGNNQQVVPLQQPILVKPKNKPGLNLMIDTNQVQFNEEREFSKLHNEINRATGTFSHINSQTNVSDTYHCNKNNLLMNPSDSQTKIKSKISVNAYYEHGNANNLNNLYQDNALKASYSNHNMHDPENKQAYNNNNAYFQGQNNVKSISQNQFYHKNYQKETTKSYNPHISSHSNIQNRSIGLRSMYINKNTGSRLYWNETLSNRRDMRNLENLRPQNEQETSQTTKHTAEYSKKPIFSIYNEGVNRTTNRNPDMIVPDTPEKDKEIPRSFQYGNPQASMRIYPSNIPTFSLDNIISPTILRIINDTVSVDNEQVGRTILNTENNFKCIVTLKKKNIQKTPTNTHKSHECLKLFKEDPYIGTSTTSQNIETINKLTETNGIEFNGQKSQIHNNTNKKIHQEEKKINQNNQIIVSSCVEETSNNVYYKNTDNNPIPKMHTRDVNCQTQASSKSPKNENGNNSEFKVKKHDLTYSDVLKSNKKGQTDRSPIILEQYKTKTSYNKDLSSCTNISSKMAHKINFVSTTNSSINTQEGSGISTVSPSGQEMNSFEYYRLKLGEIKSEYNIGLQNEITHIHSENSILKSHINEGKPSQHRIITTSVKPNNAKNPSPTFMHQQADKMENLVSMQSSAIHSTLKSPNHHHLADKRQLNPEFNFCNVEININTFHKNEEKHDLHDKNIKLKISSTVAEDDHIKGTGDSDIYNLSKIDGKQSSIIAKKDQSKESETKYPLNSEYDALGYSVNQKKMIIGVDSLQITELDQKVIKNSQQKHSKKDPTVNIVSSDCDVTKKISAINKEGIRIDYTENKQTLFWKKNLTKLTKIEERTGLTILKRPELLKDDGFYSDKQGFFSDDQLSLTVQNSNDCITILEQCNPCKPSKKEFEIIQKEQKTISQTCSSEDDWNKSMEDELKNTAAVFVGLKGGEYLIEKTQENGSTVEDANNTVLEFLCILEMFDKNKFFFHRQTKDGNLKDFIVSKIMKNYYRDVRKIIYIFSTSKNFSISNRIYDIFSTDGKFNIKLKDAKFLESKGIKCGIERALIECVEKNSKGSYKKIFSEMRKLLETIFDFVVTNQLTKKKNVLKNSNFKITTFAINSSLKNKIVELEEAINTKQFKNAESIKRYIQDYMI